MKPEAINPINRARIVSNPMGNLTSYFEKEQKETGCVVVEPLVDSTVEMQKLSTSFLFGDFVGEGFKELEGGGGDFGVLEDVGFNDTELKIVPALKGQQRFRPNLYTNRCHPAQ